MRLFAKGLLLSLIATLPLSAQIVTPGQKPVGLESGLRSAILMAKAEVGRFDRDSALLEIERANRNAGMLRSFVFAQKEMLRKDIIKEGTHFTNGDREVWHFRVTSRGAESLSFYFSDFYLPEGAFLSIFSVSNPQVFIGPFGADNNSALRALSTVPITADDVIIEVAAPRGATPRMTLEEVNTGLLNLFNKYDAGAFSCSPDAACMPQVSDLARSVVMILTDGTTIGSGALVNNGRQDGTPYILTASHVMNWNFNHMDYDRRASKTIAVFNYHSPLCGDGIRPAVSQAVSGATMVGVDETTDLALIKMETPVPASYRPYYAGWNANANPAGPFLNLHHPSAQPTKYNQFDGELAYASFPDRSMPFGKDLFHKVSLWTIGTTAPVSSGSPLLDRDKRIIGALTGGDSYCGPVGSDYFSSLEKLWGRASSASEARTIVEALTGGNTGLITLRGREAGGSLLPEATRVGHIALDPNGGRDIRSQLSQVPREVLTGYTEVAERYDLNAGATLHGVYLLFDVKASASATMASEPLALTIYNAESGAKVTEIPVPQEQLTLPSDEDSLRELYVALPEPLSVSSVTPLLFALNTSGFPSGTVIASNRGDTGTAFGKTGSDVRRLEPAASLWIDLLLSDKKLAEQPMPFVQITSDGSGQLILTFDPKYADARGDLSIYTVLGQPVAKLPISGGYLLVPRNAVAGLGVLVFKINLGDREEALKVLVQK